MGYTARSLTKPRDRLLALSGIAEQFSSLWPESEYKAGLWTHELLKSLEWRRQGELKSRPTKYRAPSWSWASMESSIIHGHGENLRLPSVVQQVEVTLAHEGHPFGEVTGGYLILSTIVRRAWWDQEEMEIFEVAEDGAGRILSSHSDSDRGEVGYAYADALEDLGDAPVHLAVLGERSIGFTGIILERLSSGAVQDPMYHRVGWFTAPFCDKSDWNLQQRQSLYIV